MEPTIYDIGRPTIRSSRPIPPKEDERKWMQLDKKGQGEMGEDENAGTLEEEQAPEEK